MAEVGRAAAPKNNRKIACLHQKNVANRRNRHLGSLCFLENIKGETSTHFFSTFFSFFPVSSKPGHKRYPGVPQTNKKTFFLGKANDPVRSPIARVNKTEGLFGSKRLSDHLLDLNLEAAAKGWKGFVFFFEGDKLLGWFGCLWMVCLGYCLLGCCYWLLFGWFVGVFWDF